MVYKPAYSTPQPARDIYVHPVAPTPAPATTDQSAPPPTPRPGGFKPAYAGPPRHQPTPNDLHPEEQGWLSPSAWGNWASRNASENWQKASTAKGSDWANSALDDVTMGGADWAQHLYTGEPTESIRARTAASQAALGPLASNTLAAGSWALGPGKFIKPIVGAARLARMGGLGAAALEGSIYSGGSALGHGEHDVGIVAKDTAEGAVGGVAGRALGEGVIAPIVRRVKDYVKGYPGRPGDTVYGGARTDLATDPDAAAPAIQTDAARQQAFQTPGTDEYKALERVKQYAGTSTEPGWAAKAGGMLTGDVAGAIAGKLPNVPLLSDAITAGGAWTGKNVINPIARTANTWDRNVSVNNALDELYRTQMGAPVTGSTVNWSDFGRGFGTTAGRTDLPYYQQP